MLDPLLLSFLAVAALLTITPGADMALVAHTTLRHGRRAGHWSILGVVSGLTVHATFSALGISVLLARSAEAFEVLRLAGAAVLLYLGARGLHAAWRAHRLQDEPPAPPLGARGAYARGLLSNLLNPKVAVFYLAFLPQFLAPGQDPLLGSLGLAALHLGMGLVWLWAYAGMVHRLGERLRAPRVRARLEAVTGGVLVLFGARLLLERGPQRA